MQPPFFAVLLFLLGVMLFETPAKHLPTFAVSSACPLFPHSFEWTLISTIWRIFLCPFCIWNFRILFLVIHAYSASRAGLEQRRGTQHTFPEGTKVLKGCFVDLACYTQKNDKIVFKNLKSTKNYYI